MERWEVLRNGRKAMLYRQGAAGDFGISRPTVYELLKRNEFRWIQVGTKYRISKKSFDEWLDKMMENP